MTGPAGRRGFLRGLVSLPLIGGGVTLIGAPTAVAEPATFELLDAYRVWLHYERRWLVWEMAGDPAIQRDRCFDRHWMGVRPHQAAVKCLRETGELDHGSRSYFAGRLDASIDLTKPAARYHDWMAPCETGRVAGLASPASTRAALVLGTVGCDWREG